MIDSISRPVVPYEPLQACGRRIGGRGFEVTPEKTFSRSHVNPPLPSEKAPDPKPTLPASDNPPNNDPPPKPNVIAPAPAPAHAAPLRPDLLPMLLKQGTASTAVATPPPASVVTPEKVETVAAASPPTIPACQLGPRRRWLRAPRLLPPPRLSPMSWRSNSPGSTN